MRFIAFAGLLLFLLIFFLLCLTVVVVVVRVAVLAVAAYQGKSKERKKHYVVYEQEFQQSYFGKGLRKTAARTLLFSSGALSGTRRVPMRPGGKL